jgi:hypothetical protein
MNLQRMIFCLFFSTSYAPFPVIYRTSIQLFFCVVDPDPHKFGCPGSGSALGMRIRIRTQEHENCPN